MKRILIALAAAAGLLPAPAFALGVGELTLESGLNEPFEARIALLSVTREELDSLNIGLADNEAFRRAGVDRPFVLSSLRFELVETEAGADYIRVSSSESIREPFLNFLVEVSWSKGRLYREYTVLLDPPLYDSRAAPTYARVPAAPVATAAPAVEPLPAEAGEAEYAPAPAFTGSEYGPTETSDTLWSIAGRTRPDAGVTMQQMMLALLRANPDAFISGNVNGLRRGQILKVPGREEIDEVAPDQALAEVKSQYALWDDIRGTIASAPQARPETTAAAAAPAAQPAPAPVAREDTTELRLVAAADTGAGTDQGSGGGGAEVGQLRDRLALASEQAAAVSQENAELKDKLAESDAIIADLKRLISLKDDELAALQQQMAAGAAAPEPVEAPVAEQAAEEKTDVEPAPAAVAPETDAVPPAEAPAPEESGAAAPEAPPQTAQEPAAERPASEKPAAAEQKPAKPAPAPAKPEPTLVDQALEFVTGNLLIIGVAVGAIVLLIAGIAAVGRFRSRMEASAETVPVEEFPDFTGDEGETELPGSSEDVTGVREQPAHADASSAAASGKEDATMFALPPEPKAKPASAAKAAAEPAPAAASPEDVLDAFHHEVNVFMAYEDWDQAEQFVRDAIGREPNNLDFHAKLLEVFFTSGNRKKYETAAKVLHDVVDGAGPYWDNAVVMWNEMSPNRALFAAGGEEDEGPAATAATGGGLLDLTAAASRGDAGLDFDLGEATAEPAAKPAASEDEPVLDITGTGAEGAGSPQPAAEEGGDMLDVTAAVGLETEEAALELEAAAPEEGVLDLTGGSEQPAGDLLDVSGSGTDLLDVTAQTDVGAQEISDEDLLDVTSTAASARDAAEEAAPAAAEESAGEHMLDFNLEDVPLPAASADEPAEPSPDSGNVIEFESSGGGLELAVDDESGGPSMDETSLGGGLELDTEATIAEDAGGLELDLTVDDLPVAEEKASDEIDMDGTVEIPKLELVDEDDDEDGEDHTVFVPRSGDAQEQSVEDKMASQLDLAKAYVEMGTKESKETAKGILNQVLADGTEQQKRKAQDLIRMLS